MSDFSQSARTWRIFLEDMVRFCERVLDYTAGLDQPEFVADSRTFDASVHNIILIGEAATHIPPEVRDAHPEIPWRLIVGARNRMVHGYMKVDSDTVWSIIQDDIPDLLPKLRRLLDVSEQRRGS